MVLRVILTKHAVERLFERFPKHKKFEAEVIANVIENVIKSGVVLERGGDIKISTSRYTLCCILAHNKLIVKTVLRTKEMGEKYRKAMNYGKRSPWNVIFIENLKQVKKWCDDVKKLKNVCKICGISREQTPIERCNIYGFYVCSFCCVSIGGYSDKCRGCAFDVHVKSKKKHENILYIA